jgi:RimJ/RimL family protein N-acetyltransferase
LKLIPIEEQAFAARILWDLLAERPAEASISHKEMPTWTAHLSFIEHHEYRAWRFILTEEGIVGAIYLTMNNEIGIGIFKAHQRKGYGTAAIMMLMTEYGPKKYLANISPRNPASRRMFEKLGFKFIQETLALE